MGRGGPGVVRIESVAAGTVIEVHHATGRSVGILASAVGEFAFGSGDMQADIAAGPVAVELPARMVPITLVVNGEVNLVVEADDMEVSGPAPTVGGEGIVTFGVPD